jgi:transposase
MGNPAGVRRDFAALEERRMEAARLLKEGRSQSEVARVVGVHRQSVSRWARELEQSGMRGLRKAKHTGRPAKLTPVQLRDLGRALQRGPEAFGFASGLWTASRVRDLIEYRAGVRYHEDHVWRILRKLNWTCQRPTGKALERDEQAIRQWKKYRWPQIKKKPSARSAPSSSSTKAD